MSWAHRKLVPASCADFDFCEIEAELLAGALVLSWHGRRASRLPPLYQRRRPRPACTPKSRCAAIMREENNDHLHSALQPDRRWYQGCERLAAPARRRQEATGRHGRRDEAVLHGDG